MSVIYKFGLGYKDYQEIALPHNAKILTVQMQNGFPTLWAEVDPDEWTVPHGFYLVGTGHTVPGDVRYLATVQEGNFVWHIYQSEH